MRWQYGCVAMLALSGGTGAQQPDNRDEIEQLRQALDELKTQYEARIETLERRLAEAEKKIGETAEDAEKAREQAEELALAPRASSGGSTSRNALNPEIGVVIQATAASLDVEADGYSVPGFTPPESAGTADKGLSLGETEINLQTAIDDKFYGNVTVALEDAGGETEVGIDEAWFETMALPAGLKLRGGRFFSAIGYLNSFHIHADDFIDRPLPYQALFGKRYSDNGLQLSWVKPIDALLFEFGGEVMQGEGFPAAADDGLGAFTLFSHLGGDFGAGSSWRLGASYLEGDVDERTIGGRELALDPADPASPVVADPVFNGESRTWGLDFVYKWAPNGNATVRNFVFQGEGFVREEDGRLAALPFDGEQSGYYVQGVYQWRPGWRFGYRFDALDSDNRGIVVPGSFLDPRGLDPMRHSVMIEWSNSGFSRIRGQYIRDESTPVDDDQFLLNYVLSFGAHAAHKF